MSAPSLSNRSAPTLEGRNKAIAAVMSANPKVTAQDVNALLDRDATHLLTPEQLALVPDGFAIDNAAEQRIALAVIQDAVRDQAREARKAGTAIATTEPPQPFTLASLAGMQFPPLASLPILGHSDVIVKGWAHILTGDAKAGKTTLLVNAFSEWTAQGESVRYFSEESARLWDARRREMPAEFFDNDKVTVVPAITMSYEDMLTMARECPETVIVVDTIRTLWGFEDERDNSEAVRACKPWVAMAQETGKTLILGHHDRKSGGTNGLSISGAGAFLAVVDMAVMVSRDPVIDVRRKVETLGRVVTPAKFLYELTGDRLRDLGNSAALQFDEVKRRCLDVLDTERPMTTAQIRAELDPKPSLSQVDNALKSMASIGNRIHRLPDISEKAAGRKVTWLLGPRDKRTAA
jgi:hypothetical protein